MHVCVGHMALITLYKRAVWTYLDSRGACDKRNLPRGTVHCGMSRRCSDVVQVVTNFALSQR